MSCVSHLFVADGGINLHVTLCGYQSPYVSHASVVDGGINRHVSHIQPFVGDGGIKYQSSCVSHVSLFVVDCSGWEYQLSCVSLGYQLICVCVTCICSGWGYQTPHDSHVRI